MLFKSLVTLLSVSSLVAAAPTSMTPTVIVENKCSTSLKVGHSIDVSYYGDVVDVPAGSSHTLTLPLDWSGRIWGRSSCSGEKCFDSGMGSPASLAEFHFKSEGKVYYDISLVDGWNLPMVITPVNKIALEHGDASLCATTSCTTLPECPAGWETYDTEGKVSGCKSACTMYNTDEYCCTGAFYDPKVCKANQFTEAVKAVCPDVYSYAFDDYTSAFMCTSFAYTVTFC
ncbi:unnamed protein product [Mucor hiemalis]